jgi:hypothetical protein
MRVDRNGFGVLECSSSGSSCVVSPSFTLTKLSVAAEIYNEMLERFNRPLGLRLEGRGQETGVEAHWRQKRGAQDSEGGHD